MQRFVTLFLSLCAACAPALSAHAQQLPPPATAAPALAAPARPPVVPSTRQVASVSIQDIARLGGQGEFPLRGIGIVVGLKGTGDSGSELAVAQPLAALYERSGNPLPDLKHLGKAKSAAIVWVDCKVRAGGAREDDRFDVNVAAMHSATSLKGGRLIITPLTEIRLENPRVFAFASGAVQVTDEESSTTGIIYSGAQMARAIQQQIGTDSFDLVVRPECRSYTTTRVIASEVNGLRANLEEADTPAEPVAFAMDDQTIRVVIPEEERADPTNFIASILTKSFSPDLLDLKAMVIIDRVREKIVLTGDVEISAVTIGSDNLRFISSATPTPGVPDVQDHLAPVGTTGRRSEQARIQDLLDAFDAIDIPFDDRVDLIQAIHRTGRLHADLIIE